MHRRRQAVRNPCADHRACDATFSNCGTQNGGVSRQDRNALALCVTDKAKQVLEDLAAGKVDLLVGTHRIISKDIKFKDLGLLVVDEEQRFGVAQKEK